MAVVIAKDSERLEQIYYREHGLDDGRYYEFCELNMHLCAKDHLDAGDVVTLLPPNIEDEKPEEEGISLW